MTAGGKENDDATMVYVYIGKRNNDHARLCLFYENRYVFCRRAFDRHIKLRAYISGFFDLATSQSSCDVLNILTFLISGE